MKQFKFSYVYLLLPLLFVLLFSTSYGFPDTTVPNSNREEEGNINSVWDLADCPTDYMTPQDLTDSIRRHNINVKSNNVEKKVLNKKNSWNKLITITGDIDKDFNSVIALLEKSKDTDWNSWKLIRDPRCFPESNPVVIRSDYITEIKGYKVRAVFTTYIDTKKAFLVNAWVVNQ